MIFKPLQSISFLFEINKKLGHLLLTIVNSFYSLISERYKTK